MQKQTKPPENLCKTCHGWGTILGESGMLIKRMVTKQCPTCKGADRRMHDHSKAMRTYETFIVRWPGYPVSGELDPLLSDAEGEAKRLLDKLRTVSQASSARAMSALAAKREVASGLRFWGLTFNNWAKHATEKYVKSDGNSIWWQRVDVGRRESDNPYDIGGTYCKGVIVVEVSRTSSDAYQLTEETV